MLNYRIDQLTAAQLGPEGPGYLALPDVLPLELVDRVQSDLSQATVPWQRIADAVRNRRGVTVTQAFEYFAHKLSAGNQELWHQLPGIAALTTTIMEDVIAPLSSEFPSLETWRPDEMSAQRYTHNEGHIDWHYDRARYRGIILITNMVGEATLGVIDSRDQEDRAVYLEEGSILALRATNLYPDSGMSVEHAVLQTSDGRVSLTYRANDLPDDPNVGFRYHNWPVVD